MVAPSREAFSGAQKATIGLTIASAVLVLVSGVLVLQQLGAIDAGPGFAEFLVLVVLLIGMLRHQKIAFLGVLGAKVILVLVALGAFAVRPAAMNLSWFPAGLGANILLGVAIIYFSWKSLREM